MKTKNIFYVLFILFVFSLSIIKIKAYKCVYDVELQVNSIYTPDSEASITIDPANNKIEVPTKIFGRLTLFGDKEVDTNYSDSEMIKQLNNSCPEQVYACSTMGGNIAIFLDGQNYMNLEQLVGGDAVINKASNCSIATYDKSKSTAPSQKIEFNCDYYDKQLELLKINDSNSNVYILEKEKIKNFCKTTLSYGDYNLNPCVKPCLELAKDIADIEGTTVSKVGFCGLSDELLAWIRNIIKYGKYFLPVIVIVLGILDFIKAIASSNDDDMKKAQDKFVKRLISAALVFLVPLIIGFIMDQFGFTPEYCGIFK